MHRLVSAGTYAVALAISGTASADVVITGYGVFSDCDAASEFRDGPLVAMLDGAFTNYDAEFEARISQMIGKFSQYVTDAQSAYDAADADQQRRIAFTVGKWAFFAFLADIDPSKLPKSVTDGYSDPQLQVFAEVVNASNHLKVDVAQSIVMGNPPDNLLSDQAYSIALDVLSKYGGPVGLFLASAGKLGVDLAKDYWETQPIKDAAQQDVTIFLDAIRELQGKSKGQKIAEINAVKNQIDAACN